MALQREFGLILLMNACMNEWIMTMWNEGVKSQKVSGRN
jgi:hypothetical protein